LKSEVESKEKLFKEIGELRQRVAELERLEKDQKFTEDALRESEGKSRMLINATTDFVTLLSPEGFILAVNDEVCKSLNREREDLIGCSIYDYEDIVPPELVEYRKSRINEVVQLKTPIFLEDAFNGRHLDIRIHPVLDMEGNVNQIAVFSRDITEKKQSETKLIDYQNNLRLLTSQLTLAEEKERRRIATDLHDSVGQALSLSYIKLGALREVISAHGLEHEVDGIRNLVERSIEDIHSLTFELYPSFLFELGFEKALECLTEEIQNQHGLSLFFKKDDKPKPLDEDVHFLIFRTVRELLINIVKHAKTKKSRSRN